MEFPKFIKMHLFLLMVCFFGCGPAPKRAVSGSPSPERTLPPAGNGTLPVSPLASSFLTVNVLKADGTPAASSVFSELNSGFEGMTGELGELSVPLSKVLGRSLNLKIALPAPLGLMLVADRTTVYSDVELPADLVDSINVIRAKVGLSPLEGTSLPDGVVPSTGASDLPAVLERKLALQMPDNLVQSTAASGGDAAPAKQRIVASSLPADVPQSGKAVGLWTMVENRSTESAARFVWSNPFGKASPVRLAFAQDELSLSLWDGGALTLPIWPEQPAGTNLISDFSGCTDSDFRESSSGVMTSATGSRCGFLRGQFPFHSSSDVYVRLVAESENEVRMSAVFKMRLTGSAPVLSVVSGQSIRINASLEGVKVNLTDSDSTLTCVGSLSVVSSNVSLVPNSNVSIGGTAPECLLSLTPVMGAAGNSDLTIVASDGSLTSSTKFNLVVSESNMAPALSAVFDPQSPQSTDEDTTSQPILLTVEDVDGPQQTCSSLFFSYESFTPAIVAPSGAVVWGGTWPNCYAKVTPAPDAFGTALLNFFVSDGTKMSAARQVSLVVNPVNDAPYFEKISSQTTAEDTTLGPIDLVIRDSDVGDVLDCNTSITVTQTSDPLIMPVAGIVLSGQAPNCKISLSPAPNRNGDVTVTLQVKDNQLATSATMSVKVNAVNDIPVVSHIGDLDTLEDTSKAMTVTISDPDGALNCSGNLTVFSNSNLSLFPSNRISISGTTPDCSVQFSPALNLSGSSDIGFIFNDGFVAVYSNIFRVNVAAVNDAPTIAAITAQSTNEDTPSAAIAVNLSDVDGPSQSCNSANLGYTSGTPTVVASTGAVTWGGTWPNCTAVIAPVANASGTSSITFTASDGTLTSAAQSFILTVTAVNDAPTMTT
ncbi:MAG: hypothetical protein RIR26_774, partial [Pseudomonadota bacterium]